MSYIKANIGGLHAFRNAYPAWYPLPFTVNILEMDEEAGTWTASWDVKLLVSANG
jgi:hypothetical protein